MTPLVVRDAADVIVGSAGFGGLRISVRSAESVAMHFRSEFPTADEEVSDLRRVIADVVVSPITRSPLESCVHGAIIGSGAPPNLSETMRMLTEERSEAAASAEAQAPPTVARRFGRSTALALLVAMRPGDWIKNVLVF